jgi:hypothetical protein
MMIASVGAMKATITNHCGEIPIGKFLRGVILSISLLFLPVKNV